MMREDCIYKNVWLLNSGQIHSKAISLCKSLLLGSHGYLLLRHEMTERQL